MSVRTQILTSTPENSGPIIEREGPLSPLNAKDKACNVRKGEPEK
jgi:hypothetical protein